MERNQTPYQSKHTLDPSQEWWGYHDTQTQTKAPHNSSEPNVHRAGTEAARAMEVTWPDVTLSPGVGLHPNACAALELEAERATPRHLGTGVPRTCQEVR